MSKNTATRSTDAAPRIDPITLEVIRCGVVSITNQIDANITRTAFSSYVYEYKDFAVGLVDVKRPAGGPVDRRNAALRRRRGGHGGA